METLKQQLKTQIIEALNLEDLTPADIQDDAPLFGEGLGLDSIDALELIMLLEKNYGIKISRMNLVVLHPDFTTYKVVPVPVMEREVKVIVDYITKN